MRGLRQAASRAALLAVVLCLASAGATSIAAAKRVALVIGNGAYANAPTLPNPPNDAKAIAADLEKLGFEVHLALDVTQEKGLATLDEFAAALPGAEAAVFFYSGHGMQIDGEQLSSAGRCRGNERAHRPLRARSTSRKSSATWRRTPT